MKKKVAMVEEYCFFESPNGWFRITASHDGITQISLWKIPDRAAGNPGNPILKRCCDELSEYFNRTRTAFAVPLDLHGTEFQLKVWRSLARIPYGSTTSYGVIARNSGKSTAYQAVGQIVGNNPIPVILPCHRVMGSDGKLTGFGWGIPWKIWLLRHENIEIGFFLKSFS